MRDGAAFVRLELANSSVDGITQVHPQLKLVTFYASMQARVPAARRDAVLRYLALANWGLAYGSFEMDLTDGEVRFRSSIDFADLGLTAERLFRAVSPALALVERYQPGLAAVVEDGVSPEEAIRAVESSVIS